MIVGDRLAGDRPVGDCFLAAGCGSKRLSAARIADCSRATAQSSCHRGEARAMAAIGDLAGSVRRGAGHWIAAPDIAYSKMTRYSAAAPRNTTDTFFETVLS
jgi:hypothetical protein